MLYLKVSFHVCERSVKLDNVRFFTSVYIGNYSRWSCYLCSIRIVC